MAGFIDLHAHYLAAVDDGSPDINTTTEMVKGVAALGFTHLYATPHQREGLYLPSPLAIDAAFRQMTAPGIGLGAENFWDETFLGRVKKGTIPSYDGGPAFLFEVPPPLMPVSLEATLFEIRLTGKLPVMAHPERYHAIQVDLQRARALGQTAALVVDLAALDGAHGRAEMRTARQLLSDGLVHAAATDIHGVRDLPAIAAGMSWIRKHLGEAMLQTLLAENPRRILAGELPDLGS
jgi:protein-tyrosine phosphatase